jgi:hypothetical protein
MADIVADGRTRVSWVGSIANKQSPTVAELNAGIQLQSFMTADGLAGLQPDQTTIPTTSLASKTGTARNGRTNFDQVTPTFKKQDASDTPYTTLLKGTSGYLVVRNSIDEATAWAAGQGCRVYPAECGEIAWMDPEENSLERYQIPMTVTADPAQRAVVV